MHNLSKYHFYLYMLFLVFFANTMVFGEQLLLRVPDTTATVGDTLYMPVYADSSLTGKDVFSADITLSYNHSLVEPISVIKAGTIIDGFESLEANLNMPGIIKLSGASTVALSGEGVFSIIVFKLVNNGTSNLNFVDEENIFNEGVPLIITKNGNIRVNAKPVIRVTPDDKLLLSGEQQQMNVSGGEPPYTWSVSDPSVASVDNTGLLTALGRGLTRVRVQDSDGLIDSTDQWVEVREIEMYFNDTSGWEKNSVDIPVYINDISPVGIISGAFTISYDDNDLLPVGYRKDNTILEEVSSIQVNNNTPGDFHLSFATTNSLTGSGKFIIVTFEILDESGGSSSLRFEDVIFNEDIKVITNPGMITIKELPDLSVTPGMAELQVGESVNFSVSGGLAPYTWTTSNPVIGDISNDGELTALGGGKIRVEVTDQAGATGTSGDIIIYSSLLSVLDVNFPPGSDIVVPVFLDSLMDDAEIFSFQMDIAYDTTKLNFVDVTGDDLPTGSWMLSSSRLGDYLNVAAAGSAPLPGKSTLFNMHFTYKPGIAEGQAITITPDNLLFNEGLPFIDRNGGKIRVSEKPGTDLGIISLIAPSSACTGDGNEILTIKIENAGTTNFLQNDTIFFYYQVNEGTINVNKVVTEEPLLPGEILMHSFTQPYDFSHTGKYNVKIFLGTGTETNHGNDTLNTSVQVFGNPDVDLGPDTLDVTTLPVTLDAGAGYSSYTWNGITGSQTKIVNTEGSYIVVVTNKWGCEGTDTIFVRLKTSVLEMKNNPVVIYPNPAISGFYIKLETSLWQMKHVRVFDECGRIIYDNKLETIKDNLEIDLSHVGYTGICFVKIIMQDNREFVRFVIVH